MEQKLNKSQLIEETINKNLGQLSSDGALLVDTGKFTGRAATCRFVVNHTSLNDSVDWGKVNKPIDSKVASEFFQKIEEKLAHTKETADTYTMDGFVGAFPVQVTSTSPWHIAFAQNMFRESGIDSVLEQIKMDDTAPKKIQILHDPYGKVSDYDLDWDAETLIALDLENFKVAITGTAYAGEIKKSAFSASNYILPAHGIFPMHSSANCEKDGSNSCVLFGLSGTGKTTLSADPNRALIGDDEIIWTKNGLSNLEGGCYAKLIRLSQKSEPEIHSACHQAGTICENVGHKDGKIDFDDESKTENTRGSYDISALSNVFDQNRESDAPKTIVFLTADAFGALPAVAKLNFWQAQYHFISGYTAKVAGTEMGVTEPQAAFSACFGAPFMPRHPAVYAKMLAEKAQETNATVWLLNTGWVGGYESGKRFPIEVSRQILAAIQSGELEKQPTTTHPLFGFEVPTSCEGIESKWLELPEGVAVQNLAEKFSTNFEQFESVVKPEVLINGGPGLKAVDPAHSQSKPSEARI